MLVGRFWSFCNQDADHILSDRHARSLRCLCDCVMFGGGQTAMNNLVSLFHVLSFNMWFATPYEGAT